MLTFLILINPEGTLGLFKSILTQPAATGLTACLPVAAGCYQARLQEQRAAGESPRHEVNLLAALLRESRRIAAMVIPPPSGPPVAGSSPKEW
ncbi:unnamed protein product [Trichogramma brassicae]|uniref:Uncharacterized protein n=1 Tax=Trichogramma brassicae TaxID=86971 RepID=A0A6H5HWZ3_9HYME|nr:unnamed protein product [Trichogramma brassicae]